MILKPQLELPGEKTKAVKELIRKKRLRMAEVAAAAGICEGTLYSWLRHELTDDRYRYLLEAVSKVNI